MLSEKEILANLINLGQAITQIKDVDILLERILTESRRFVNADAGSIYIKTNDTLLFSYAQNATLQAKLPQGKKLIYSSFSIPVNNKSIAGYVANTGKTVNIADVYCLPDTVPFSFDKQFDEVTKYRSKSILAFPFKNPENEILGVLQLINAKSHDGSIVPFHEEDEPFIMHFANTAAIALERAQMTRAIILRMLRMAEMRDPKETGAHVNRVGAFSSEIYQAWATKKGVSGEEIDKTRDLLRMAAMLHDVGKVAISDVILKKPARLDIDEFEIMKEHTFLGAKLFADPRSDFDEAAFHIALEHHERWDGNGYPGNVVFDKDASTNEFLVTVQNEHKKSGAGIHIFARIVAVADVYDALCSRRCYKEAWDDDHVFKNMKEESGKHFDPDVIDAFFEVSDVLNNIRRQFPDE